MESALAYVRRTIDDPRVELNVLQGMDPNRISLSGGEAYQKVTNAIEGAWPGCVPTP